jgi:leader peptidase (prepilin peptidase)/N-methyltransferase
MIKYFVFIFFCITISLVDIKTYRIPDWLLVSAWLVMLLFDIHKDTLFFSERLGCACLSYVVFYFIFIFKGGLGFGDVKLAAFLGYVMSLNSIIVFYAALVILCMVLYFTGKFIYRWKNNTKLPFAPLLCAASSLAMGVNL